MARRGAIIAGLGVVLMLGLLPFDQALTAWGRSQRDAVRARSEPGGYAIEQATQAFGRVEGVVACALLLGLLARGTGRGRRRVTTLVLAVVLASVSAGVVKVGVGRMRPGPAKREAGSYVTRIGGPAQGLRDSAQRSFPSGHTTVAAANAAVLASFHPMLAPAAIGLAALVGLERVYTAKHFPSDVVGGALLGAFLSVGVVRRRERGALRMPWEASTEMASESAPPPAPGA